MESERFTSIFTRMQSRLHHVARLLLGSDADASDALQDVFCVLWGKRDEIADERTAEGLAVVSVRNRCLDALRRRKMLDNVDVSEISHIPDADGMAGDTDSIYRRVDAIIKTLLSERDRRILLLRDYSGWEMADIAEDCGLSEANVRMILSRARRAVAKAYRMNNSKSECHE